MFNPTINWMPPSTWASGSCIYEAKVMMMMTFSVIYFRGNVTVFIELIKLILPSIFSTSFLSHLSIYPNIFTLSYKIYKISVMIAMGALSPEFYEKLNGQS